MTLEAQALELIGLAEKKTWCEADAGRWHELTHQTAPAIARAYLEARAEIERLTEECSALSADQCGAGYAGEYGHHMCGLVDAEKERADKAEKLLADVRYFSRRWSGCKAVADYIDEQAALPESAPKAQDMKEKPHGT